MFEKITRIVSYLEDIRIANGDKRALLESFEMLDNDSLLVVFLCYTVDYQFKYSYTIDYEDIKYEIDYKILNKIEDSVRDVLKNIEVI